MTACKYPTEPEAKIGPDDPMAGIIAEAYRVFKAPKPSTLGVCSHCCMERRIEADFLNPAIESLPLHYLQSWYNAEVEGPHVPKDTWIYLLPRILEVMAVGEDVSMIGPEVVLKRFPTGDRTRWTASQWAVLDEFRFGYLEELRDPTGRRSGDHLDDIVCALAIADYSLQDIFAQIWRWPDETLAMRFHKDWCYGQPSIWIDTFWERDLSGQSFAFYTSKAMHDRMLAFGCADSTPKPFADKALQVADVIWANASWCKK